MKNDKWQFLLSIACLILSVAWLVNALSIREINKSIDYQWKAILELKASELNK